MLKDSIFQHNPDLTLLEKDRSIFLKKCATKEVKKSSLFIMPGAESRYLPYVLEGGFKVYKMAENGREITLYRIEKQQSCILTALSILNETPFPATVESETDSEVLLIPAELLRYLVENYHGWRNHIFSMYNNRFDIVLTLIDELLFRRLDIRLAEFLLKKSQQASIVKITHQNIADELGSRREVISRLLKEFEFRGILHLSRGSISIRDVKELTKITEAL